MLDLVILLSMALALTTVLALLLAGFVWTPWLIGILLVGLLIALGRVSVPTEQPVMTLDSSNAKKATKLQPSSSNLPSPNGAEQATSHAVEQPVLTYRGAHPAPQAAPSAPLAEPTLTYRGAKSQLHEVIPSALIAKWQGKYRGSPLKRPEDSKPS